MLRFQQKSIWAFLSDGLFLFRKKLPHASSQGQKKTMFNVFFSVFKRKIFILTFLQILFLSFILCLPLFITQYLEFFTGARSSETQAQLFKFSVYFFIFITFLFFLCYLKKYFLIKWKREIKYNFSSLIANALCFSPKNKEEQLLHNLNYKDTDIFFSQFLNLPKILNLLFYFPALMFSYFCIYLIMGNLSLIPLFLFFLLFLFQTRDHFFLSKQFEKATLFLQSRIEMINKIFHYKNRLQLLAMESFFLKKIASFQEEEYVALNQVSKKIALSKTLFYFYGILIAIPSLAVFSLFHKSAHLASITSLLIFFIIVSYFYENVIKIFAYKEEIKNNYKLLKNNFFYHNKKISKNENSLKKKTIKKLQFQKASFFSSNKMSLYNIQFDLTPGTLVAVLGEPASGKSTFLSACAGRLKMISGAKVLPRYFEILPQQLSFIEGSFKENILLGREFEIRRYADTLKTCSLDTEFNCFEKGDESFFNPEDHCYQKSFLKKLALARTLYGKSDFYFFDEPFLTLSPQEASHLFHEGIQKHLNSTSRIIATQQVQFASLCDFILVLKDGMIVEQGSHKNLLEKGGLYTKMLYAGTNFENVKTSQYFVSKKMPQTNIFDVQKYEKINDKKQIKKMFTSTKYFLSHYFNERNSYISFILVVLSQFLLCFSFYILFSNFFSNQISKNVQVFLFCFFACLSIVSFFFFYLKNISSNLSFGGVIEKRFYEIIFKGNHERKYFHSDYLQKFSQAKESLLKFVTSFMVRSSFLLSGCLLLSLTNFFTMLLFFSFAMLVAVIFLIKKSPFIKAHFNLIAQNKKLTKSSKNFFHIFLMPNSSSLKTYALKKFRETLFKAKETALQKEKIVLFFCAFVFIFLSFIFSISLLYFVINLPSLFAGSVVLTILATTFFFKAFLHIEEDFKEFFRCVPSFEALMEASGKYQEKEKFQYSPSEYWPQKASLRIMALSCKAMGNFPHDLKNLDLFIPHAGRFGILEEKNSKETNTLFASVMLLTPYEDGSIILDDEDLRKINPVHLRERLGYISGNSFFPFLSIRENVDPFEQFDDSEIWSVLNRVGIAPSVALLRNGLNTTIEEILNPLVWSGELVFFSFARSLLQENKILLIENIPVSEEIELRINDLIHREFSNATVLICASAKSSLFNICHHLARFENDSLRRASLEKTAYHSTQPFFPEGSEIPKIL